MNRILLVEPDQYLAEIYSSALQHNGHLVNVARTVAQSVNMLDTEQFDLMILELKIAQHNGIELLYEMRSYVDWNKIRIIIHSSVPEQKMMTSKTMAQLDVDKYLFKPRTTLSELCRSVDQIMSRQYS
jgi:DNA-binding response OmpR family regulator